MGTAPDCNYVAKGNTEDEVLNGFAHASKAHGMKAEDMTPKMRQKAVSLMKRS